MDISVVQERKRLAKKLCGLSTRSSRVEHLPPEVEAATFEPGADTQEAPGGDRVRLADSVRPFWHWALGYTQAMPMAKETHDL